LNSPALQFRILGQGIEIRCDDERFRELLLANYGIFQEAVNAADLQYTIDRSPAGGFFISRNEETLVEESSDQATQYLLVYTLEKLITIDLQYRRTDLYFVHSSVLERRGRAIMIVAASGTGKSTTAWALLQHGFHYLSDELAPIDPASLTVHPYPHALCLKASPPGPYPLPENTVKTERTLHIPVAGLPSPAVTDPRPLRALLFLRRDSQVSVPELTEVSPAEAGARLYANTLNALAHPGCGLDVAISIASTVPAFTLHAGELRATCEAIAELDQAL
jgi:hypothetical protein